MCPHSPMTRRTFFALVSGAVCVLASSVVIARSQVQVFYRKIKGRLRSESAPLPAVAQHPADLPTESEHISVERALNSRCSSDNDGDPETFHWGMFDESVQLSRDQIDRVVSLTSHCAIPQAGSLIKVEKNELTFCIDAAATGQQRTACMIESGMQQQAVGLACAALGVGLIFEAQGPDGQPMSAQEFATVKMRLGAMKPSYDGAFWSIEPPRKERPWLSGNLPDPKRDSSVPLVQALQSFRSDGTVGTAASRNDLSQLFWAARGRTPHLYKSKPWGLTIPTWQGLQDISGVYATDGSRFHTYINWKNGRPTHRVESVAAPTQAQQLRNTFSPWNFFLIFMTHESHARALWEVGYQVLNTTLQASALGVSSRTVLLGENEQALFTGLPSGTPVAMVALKAAETNLLESR